MEEQREEKRKRERQIEDKWREVHCQVMFALQ